MTTSLSASSDNSMDTRDGHLHGEDGEEMSVTLSRHSSIGSDYHDGHFLGEDDEEMSATLSGPSSSIGIDAQDEHLHGEDKEELSARDAEGCNLSSPWADFDTEVDLINCSFPPPVIPFLPSHVTWTEDSLYRNPIQYLHDNFPGFLENSNRLGFGPIPKSRSVDGVFLAWRGSRCVWCFGRVARYVCSENADPVCSYCVAKWVHGWLKQRLAQRTWLPSEPVLTQDYILVLPIGFHRFKLCHGPSSPPASQEPPVLMGFLVPEYVPFYKPEIQQQELFVNCIRNLTPEGGKKPSGYFENSSSVFMRSAGGRPSFALSRNAPWLEVAHDPPGPHFVMDIVYWESEDAFAQTLYPADPAYAGRECGFCALMHPWPTYHDHNNPDLRPYYDIFLSDDDSSDSEEEDDASEDDDEYSYLREWGFNNAYCYHHPGDLHHYHGDVHHHDGNDHDHSGDDHDHSGDDHNDHDYHGDDHDHGIENYDPPNHYEQDNHLAFEQNLVRSEVFLDIADVNWQGGATHDHNDGHDGLDDLEVFVGLAITWGLRQATRNLENGTSDGG
ncbi:hypothetical protein AAL_02251 [Moelleriella libera RCEF 2490]|uniref:Uncharacterized protein n=1 Tax=Moelleriella libera RCEF 2490 TaxID=1081109 RepID=A0A168FB93_9HYPO|nr:hypothetical protein AAL_02251 [Moelleriella libera RCEF 2490]